MKGTTILLLGAATLVAYASALPYSKIPEGASLPDAFNYKKSSSNSNSNSYSQSNHDESDVNGAYHGQTFTGSKSTGYNTNGGSHSQSSSFSTSSLNGNIPPGIFGFSGVPNTPSTYSQSSLAFGNPGTAGLGLSDKSPGFASGSYVSSYGNSNGGSSNSGSSDDQSIEGVQGSGNYNGVIGSIESSVNSDAIGGHFGSAGETSFGQTNLPTSGSYGAPGNGYFVQSTSRPGTVQYWWNGPDSPFGLEGKPSGGCSSNGCSLAGNFDLSKGGAGGAHASNQGGQVGLNVHSGNPFFSKGQGGSGFGSGFISSGGSIGQSGIGSGSGIGADSGFNRRPIDGSHNPFFNGGYSGVTAESGLNTGSGSFASSNAGTASSGSGTFGSSTSSGGFSGPGNPFLHPASGSGQIPEFSGPVSTVAPEYTVHQGSGFVNAGPVGSHNPFFNSGSGSVIITPPIATFPQQSHQGFPTQSTISVTLEPQEPTPGYPTQTSTLGYESVTPGYPGSSGSFASAGTGEFQGQIAQVPSYSSQSPIGAGGFSVAYPTPSTLIPEQQPSRIDNGLRVSCSGEGRICVLKGHCINGKVSDNGQGLMQVRTGVSETI